MRLGGVPSRAAVFDSGHLADGITSCASTPPVPHLARVCPGFEPLPLCLDTGKGMTPRLGSTRYRQKEEWLCNDFVVTVFGAAPHGV